MGLQQNSHNTDMTACLALRYVGQIKPNQGPGKGLQQHVPIMRYT